MKYSAYSCSAGLITNGPIETSIVKGHTAEERHLIPGTEYKPSASKRYLSSTALLQMLPQGRSVSVPEKGWKKNVEWDHEIRLKGVRWE